MRWIIDGGNEWLEIHIEVLNKAGLNKQAFSNYSRQGGDYLYLESEYDTSNFFACIGFKIGDPRYNEIPLQVYSGYCFVSDLPSLHQKL